MIDIHSHILPEIDDGAADEETSIEMLRISEMDGIKSIIATPHYIRFSIDNTRELIAERCRKLSNAAKRYGINVDIYPGSEVFIGLEIPQLIKEGQIATLNNSEYVLMELPMGSMPDFTDDVIYRLKLDGYTPVIAHPERYAVIGKDPNRLYRIIRNGALVQMNAGSLNGVYGKHVQKTAWSLLNHGMVHFISSDAHGCRRRAPKLSNCMQLVEKEMGKDVAEMLFCLNAEAVINHKNISAPEPQEVRMKRIFSFFR